MGARIGGEAISAARFPALRNDAARDALWVLGWTRAFVFGVAIAAAALGAHQGYNEASFDSPSLTHAFGSFALSPLARWDGVWYLRIAGSGYAGANVTFFPLYPLLVWLVAGGSSSPGVLLVSSYVVSLASFAGALYLLHRLVALELGRELARPALLMLALFPAALFFGAPFSESLFLLLSVGAFYAARTGRFAAAGGAAMLAGATRAAGLAQLVPLALMWWRARPRRRRDLAWLALAPAGVVVYSAYLLARFGDALASAHRERLWFRSFEYPLAAAVSGTRAAFDGVRQLGSGSRAHVYFTDAIGDPFSIAGHNLQNFAFLAFAVVATVGVVRRLPAPYWAYTIAVLALPLSSPVRPEPLQSLPRYLATVFPIFMWMALASRTPLRRGAVLTASAMLLGVCTVRFATWHWFA